MLLQLSALACMTCLSGHLAWQDTDPSPAAEAPANYTEEDFLSRTRRLTFEGKRAGEGYFDPSGTLMSFQSERDPENPFYQIFVLDLSTGDVEQVSPGKGKTTCSFINPADTNQVMYASTHHDPETDRLMREELDFRASGQERRYSWDYDPQFELYVTERDTGETTRLSHALGYDAEGSYSPDGKLLVFTSNRHAFSEELTAEEQAKLEIDPSYFLDLYIMNADGSNVRRLTDVPGYDGGPFFSPDGERVVWRRFTEDGLLADIYTIKIDGTEERRITDFNAMSWAPYFHPSGDYILFASNKLGFSNFEVFAVDALGEKEPVRITYTDGFDGLPVPMPKGDQMVWTSSRHADGTGGQLYMAQLSNEAILAALEAAPPRNSASADSTQAKAPVEVPEADFKRTVRDHVEFLASEGLEGRLTGSEGERLASEYLAAHLKLLGAQPLPDEDDLLVPFEFTAGMEDGGTEISIATGSDTETFTGDPATLTPLSFSDSGTVSGEVVFAGYGIKVPDSSEFPYDSYHGLDVKDKIVVALRYFPEETEGEFRQTLSQFSPLRFKAKHARELGAKALVIVTGPNSPNAGETVPMRFDTSLSGSGLVAVSLGGEAADALFAAAGLELEKLQAGLDSGNPHVSGQALEGLEMTISTTIERERKIAQNVVGVLPATTGDKASEYIALGAHYDHLGHGAGGNSLARKGEDGQIHYGADDNASGVAAVLEIAETISQLRIARPRPVMVAFWSGEEMGLLGSAAFAKDNPVPMEDIAAYVNFDMVGRMKDNRLMLQGIGSSPGWARLIEKTNVPVGFDVKTSDDPFLPTDTASFYPEGIPVIHFFTGAHEDYHRPTDTPDKVNTEDLERIVRFGAGLTRQLIHADERLEYAQVERTADQNAPARGVRAFTGTIPDYTQEAKGLALSGVIDGGPADKAGLRGGDVIVEFAGQEITNIYDYMYALDSIKIGEETSVTVMRDGERVEMTLIPEARD
ncbi:MAG: M20/M25/M40 family metallo-hydrolase [Sumerlaeia bacterium]